MKRPTRRAAVEAVTTKRKTTVFGKEKEDGEECEAESNGKQ